MRSSRLPKYLLIIFSYSFSVCPIFPQSIDSVGDEPIETKAIYYSPKYPDILQTGFSNCDGDEFNPFKSNVNYPVLAGMGAAFLGTGTAIHLYQQKAWWSEQRTKFHFQDDWDYALWIDKIGHAYGAMLIQHGISAGLEAANLESEQCVWYGSIAALSFQTFIEIEDGFGPQWGFSPGDFYGDVFGSAYPVLQYYVPFFKNIMFKASYLPKDLNKTNPNSGQKHIIVDDYHGQKFWLSARMKNFLPKNIAEVWPEFLMLAVGMGVKKLDGSGGGQREFYIALDFDAETIPLYGGVWQFVKNTLNFIHFPMPGIRISPDAAFFVFCF
jgi:hypothetical protein